VTIKPTQPAPELDVATLDSERFRLSEGSPDAFTMIVFYRGHHCPICKPYLRDLDRKPEEFESFGVDVIAVSTDTKELAARSKEEWEIGRLPIGYGLEIAKVREWGLFISRGIEESEPAEFAEPVCSWCTPTVRCTPSRYRACRCPPALLRRACSGGLHHQERVSAARRGAGSRKER
jgi:AhpC/TSA family